MPSTRTLLIAAISGLSISLLPVQIGKTGPESVAAHAKGGNGNGNGNGGGNGNSGGKGGNSGNGKGASSSSSAGKSSGTAKSSSKVEKSGAGLSAKGLKAAARQQKTTKTTKTASPAKAQKKTQIASLPNSMAVPGAKQAKAKNLHAKLGRLNSLNRNISAYLNSKSPHMAAIREFVVNSAEFELATAAAADAAAKAVEAKTAFDMAVAGITAFDPNAVGSAVETLTGLRNAATVQAEIDALDAAIQAAENLALADQAAVDAAARAVAEAVGTDEAALEAALLSATNKEIDAEVIGWAKTVLGVGEVYGKIDQMRETMEPAVSPPESDPAI